MNITTLDEIDFSIIVRFDDKYYPGRIYVVNSANPIAVCKFDGPSLTHKINPSSKSIDSFELMDIFEKHDTIKDSKFQIYATNDIESLFEVFLAEYSNPLIQDYCKTKLDLIKDPFSNDLNSFISFLNDIIIDINENKDMIIDSKYTCTYHTSRKLFINNNQFNYKTYRFTLAKKIHQFLITNPDTGPLAVNLSFIKETGKIELHIINFPRDLSSKLSSYSHPLLNNNDGSLRVQLPFDVYEIISDFSRSETVILSLIETKIAYTVYCDL